MKHQLLLSVLCLMMITGCASPSTPQTLPWQQPLQQFSIKPIAPGLFQMDQFVVTYEGFEIMLTLELEKGNLPSVVIQKNPFLTVYEEEVRIAKLAESKGLPVYTSSIIGITATSSAKLQARIDARNARTWKVTGD